MFDRVQLFALVVLLAVLPGTLDAVKERIRISIPPGPAPSSLDQLAELTSSDLIYPREELVNVQMGGLSGRFSIGEALQELVSGTGLVVVRDRQSGAIAVIPGAEPLMAASGEMTEIPTPHQPYQTMFKYAFDRAPVHRVLRVLAILSFWYLPGSSLHGQEEEEVVTLPEFVVDQTSDGYVPTTAFSATRTNTRILDLPISFTVQTSEFLDDLAAESISESLRYSASVGVATSGGAGAQGVTFKIRGFDTAWMLRDGFPRFQAPNIANTDRVEVIKGAAAFLYGRSGPGGAVNYITKRPLFDERREVSLTIGSEEYTRFGVDVSGPIAETLAYRVILDNEDTEKWWDYGAERGVFAGIGFTVAPSPNTNWYVSAEYSERDFHTRPGMLMTSDLVQQRPGEATVADLALQTTIIAENPEAIGLTAAQRDLSGAALMQSLTNDQRKIVRDQFAIVDRYAPELSPRGRKLNLSGAAPQTGLDDWSVMSDFTTRLTDWLNVRNGTLLSFRRWSWNAQTNDGLPNIPLTGGALDPRGSQVQIRKDGGDVNGPALLENDVFSNQTDFSAQFETEWARFEILAGGEFWTDKFNLQLQSGRFVIDGEDVTDDGRSSVRFYLKEGLPRFEAGSGPNNPGLLLTNETRQNIAGYVNLQAIFLDEKLRLMGGFRREQSKMTEKYGAFGTDRAPTVVKTAPQVGIMYEVVDNVNVFAMMSEDYNPNQFGITREGEAIPPPDGENREIGLKAELLDGRMIIQSAFFEVEQSGRVVPDPTDNQFSIPGGAFKTQGFEFEVIAQPINDLQVVFSYAYIDSEITGVPNRDEIIGQRLADVPEHSASFWAKYEFTEGTLAGAFTGLGIRYEGDRRASDLYWIDLENEAYTAIDLLLGYAMEFNSGISGRVQLNVRNLLDEEWEERGFQPSDPREYRVGLSVLF